MASSSVAILITRGCLHAAAYMCACCSAVASVYQQLVTVQRGKWPQLAPLLVGGSIRWCFSVEADVNRIIIVE